jgi:hypothetical protein
MTTNWHVCSRCLSGQPLASLRNVWTSPWRATTPTHIYTASEPTFLFLLSCGLLAWLQFRSDFHQKKKYLAACNKPGRLPQSKIIFQTCWKYSYMAGCSKPVFHEARWYSKRTGITRLDVTNQATINLDVMLYTEVYIWKHINENDKFRE